MTGHLIDCLRQHTVSYNDNLMGWLKATISTVFQEDDIRHLAALQKHFYIHAFGFRSSNRPIITLYFSAHQFI